MMGSGFQNNCGKGENRTSWGYCLPECKMKSNFEEMRLDLSQPEILHEKPIASYISPSKTYPWDMVNFCPVSNEQNEFCAGHAAMSPYTQVYRLANKLYLALTAQLNVNINSLQKSIHRNGKFRHKTDVPERVLQLGSSQLVVEADDEYHHENINELKNVCFGEAGSSIWKIDHHGRSVLTGLMSRFEKGCGGFFTDHANPQRLINMRISSYVGWIIGNMKNDPAAKCHLEDESSGYEYGQQGGDNDYFNLKQGTFSIPLNHRHSF